MMILNKTNPETLETISTLIKEGGTVVLPCDTIYGLCAVYGLGEKALKELKGRDENKPFLVLATLKQAQNLCTDIPECIIDTWPAALTVILNSKKSNTIAIRVPKDDFLLKLLDMVGAPIYSTSVNMAGEPSLLNFTDICNRFEALVDCLVRGPEVQGTIPSTLIDATSKPFKLVRKGAFDASSILQTNA